MITTDKLIHLEHGLTAYLLQDCVESCTIPNPDEADIWIINHHHPDDILRFLKHIIVSNDARIFLKPIFLNKSLKKRICKNSLSTLKRLSDGFIDDFNITKKLGYIQSIISFKKKYFTENSKTEYHEFLEKTILYYYTRNHDIEIFENRLSLLGYTYPRIEVYFEKTSDPHKNAEKFLKSAVKEDFLKRHYLDTLHLCGGCNSGFLNYREECPKCKGHNLQMRNIIHHYRCAYVGSEDDFKKDGMLVCPKCSTALNNLGVDYDKPGKIFNCKKDSCTHQFQKPEIGVRCINCQKEQTPTELNVRKIYNYTLTEKALQLLNI